MTTPATTRTWTLDIPGWSPCLDNRLIYRHWSVARSRKRADAHMITVHALLNHVPAATTRRRLTITIRQATGPFPDDAAPLKSLLDACVKAGLLVDDSRQWLELAWPPNYERGPKRTVLVFKDL